MVSSEKKFPENRVGSIRIEGKETLPGRIN